MQPGRGYDGSELTELDLLAVVPRVDPAADGGTQRPASVASPHLRRGDRFILIQSGAMLPDGAMLQEAGRYFEPSPVSGVPAAEKQTYVESLRQRAAQGGYRYLVCCWSMLDSVREDSHGRVISWMPLVGRLVPDQTQRMRLTVRALVLDVTNGGWRTLSTEAEGKGRYNHRTSAAEGDRELVPGLQARAYRALVAELLKAPMPR